MTLIEKESLVCESKQTTQVHSSHYNIELTTKGKLCGAAQGKSIINT